MLTRYVLLSCLSGAVVCALLAAPAPALAQSLNRQTLEKRINQDPDKHLGERVAPALPRDDPATFKDTAAMQKDVTLQGPKEPAPRMSRLEKQLEEKRVADEVKARADAKEAARELKKQKHDELLYGRRTIFKKSTPSRLPPPVVPLS